MTNFIKSLSLQLEAVANTMELHIALTGGQLYKTGPRKDIDFVVYTSRQIKEVPKSLHDYLLKCDRMIPDFVYTYMYGFVCKATYKQVQLDFLYPQFAGGTYPCLENGEKT